MCARLALFLLPVGLLCAVGHLLKVVPDVFYYLLWFAAFFSLTVINIINNNNKQKVMNRLILFSLINDQK